MNEPIENVLFDENSNTMEFWEKFKEEFDRETEKIRKLKEIKKELKIKECSVKIDKLQSVYKLKNISNKCKNNIRKTLRKHFRNLGKISLRMIIENRIIL